MIFPIQILLACLGAFQFYGNRTGFYFIEENAPRIYAPNGHWSCEIVHITPLDSQQALELFRHRWLDRLDIADPNGRVVGSIDNGLTLVEFRTLSKHWQSVAVPPPVIVEPNLPDISNLCFTIGGKHHLFIDCSYLTGKDGLDIQTCDPNNICIRCAARRLSECPQ
jgi:hypothetical protein